MTTIRIVGGMIACAMALRAQNPDPRAQARVDAEKARAEAQATKEAAKRAAKDAFSKSIGDGIRNGIQNGVQQIVTNSIAREFSFSSDSSPGDSYPQGQRALDRRDYEQAIMRFDRVIAQKSPRSDGAMYWKAYAQHRSGKRDQALVTLAELEKQFPQSHWLNDARALAAEARAGGPSAEAEADEELKLLALNSLIHQEPDRTIPMLEKILKDSKSSPALKRQAMFVLARSRAPKASELLTQYAKGGANPDLQAKAIEYLGSAKSPENAQTLVAVYGSADPSTKREVIRGLRRQDAAKQLVELARKESDVELKKELVRTLSGMNTKDATDYLMELLNK